jgi:hypothetical protein
MLSLIPTMTVANSFYVSLRSGQEPARKGVTKADPATVQADLIAYYVANLHQTPSAAATMARNALLGILQNAHACD